VAIERGVDFTTIKELSQIFERVNFALLQIEGINHAFPIFARKACGPDKNIGDNYLD
jgi:hypothetical protein